MQLLFRIATLDDVATLFSWRNDPVTRQMSKNSDPVSWDDHVAWLTKRLQRDRPDLFIVEIKGTSVATIRIDDGHVSYTVSPAHRGRGIATQVLALARKIWGPLIAEVKSENIYSIKAATASGHYVRVL